MDKESKIECCTRIAQKKTPTSTSSRGLGDSMLATWCVQCNMDGRKFTHFNGLFGMKLGWTTIGMKAGDF